MQQKLHSATAEELEKALSLQIKKLSTVCLLFSSANIKTSYLY